MTNIDDSAQTPPQTPPGYWFGEIEARLHERMRAALSDLGLRRGSWRILHTLADGPATAAELADRLPGGGRRGHDGPRDGERPGGGRGYGRGHGYGHGYGHGFGHGNESDGAGRREFRPGFRPGWRGQEPRDERPADAERQHPHTAGEAHHEHQHNDDHNRDHASHHGFEHAFERGYERGFDRGFGLGALRGGLPSAPPFAPGYGGHPFGGHPYGGHPHYGPYPGGAPFGAPFPGGAPFGRRGYGRHPFGADGRDGRREHRIHRTLGDFVERGWVWFDGDRATLTDEGRSAYDAAFERVQSVRSELADGIPESDYATTLATLETMARNLGWRPSTPGESSDDAPSMDA